MIDRSVRLLLVVLVMLSGGAWLGGAAARAHGPRGITVPDDEQAEQSAEDEPKQQAEEAKDDEATEPADQTAEDEEAGAEDSAAEEDADTSADASDAPTESGDAATESADEATESAGAGGNASQQETAAPASPAPGADKASAADRDPCAIELKGGTPQRSAVKFVQNGFFLADFYVEWDAPCGGSGKAAFNGKGPGFQTTADFPSSATNIRIRATNQTGLVWQPNRPIFERTLPKVDGAVCYEVVGTALGSSVKDCKP